MSFKAAKSLGRETGIALAMLAMYVLTLLLPLHSAAGLQRDFDALGYSSISNWSVCQALAGDDDNREDVAALTCPATGVAKQQVAVLVPPALTLPEPPLAIIAVLRADDLVGRPQRPDHFGQSRAPPAVA